MSGCFTGRPQQGRVLSGLVGRAGGALGTGLKSITKRQSEVRNSFRTGAWPAYQMQKVPLGTGTSRCVRSLDNRYTDRLMDARVDGCVHACIAMQVSTHACKHRSNE